MHVTDISLDRPSINFHLAFKMAEQGEGLHLLTLPPEIREEIYKLILHPNANRLYHEDEYTSYSFKDAFVLFHINRQIYLESRKIFRDLNTFVKIETPWAETQQHVQLEGHVPIVVTKEKAYNFHEHKMTVVIGAPHHMSLELDIQRFIILADDLDKFTRMWMYADLTYPGLNEHLNLDLRLREPHTPIWEEKRMSKAQQRRLLLPFGDVKNLHETIVGGDIKPYQSIEKELRELQAKAHDSPESCLRESTRLKAEGNAELKEGRYQEALKKYNLAWQAMHVIIKGHQRHIHADAFFGRELREAPFIGKNGQAERLLLRVQLVANTCLVYLKQEEWEQCRFWGKRSINMLREAMGADETVTIRPEEEAVLGFPAADQMGKIYYRTAVACKMLGEESEARKLLRVAIIYLPRDESIQKEIAATALRLG